LKFTKSSRTFIRDGVGPLHIWQTCQSLAASAHLFRNMLDLQGATRLLLNIGSNMKPVLAPPHDNSTTALIFEPIVGCALAMKMPRLSVVVAAVSDENSISSMNVYNSAGLSSSLGTAAAAAPWNANSFLRPVPVIAMRSVLDSIPTDITLWFIKTDMQGFDFRALSSAGRKLCRAHYLSTEVWVGNHKSYNDVKNDYCAQWLPHMLKLDYVPVGLVRDQPRPKRNLFVATKNESFALAHERAARSFCQTQSEEESAALYEANAYWMLRDTDMPPPPVRESVTHFSVSSAAFPL